MSPNRSSAVMQQRSEPHDSLDDFPTPPWATRAALEWLAQRQLVGFTMSCREPCANRGYMVRPLAEVFGSVEASDVHDYGCGFPVRDYLFGPEPEPVDWTFMNPPFRLAEQFIARAIDTSLMGVACIVRSAFIEGQDRYATLFSRRPPSIVLQPVERVSMVKGRYDPKISTATAYCWLMWVTGRRGAPELHWLPPARKRLFRPEDVEPWSAVA